MARRKSKVRKVRLSIEVSPRVRAQLERVQKLVDADSLTEVIRRSVAVYETLLLIGRKNGDPAPIIEIGTSL